MQKLSPARKQKFRRTFDNLVRFSSTVGENAIFNGQFEGGENIIVRGAVRGDSDVDGVIVIMQTGKWTGTVKADNIVIAGWVEGSVEARQKLEILQTGHVKGILKCPVIAMEVGAIHEGEIQMRSETMLTEFAERRKGSLLLSD